ncbi:MAG: hypothetical protein KAT46_03250 [Deltaproteobacteria bacterium]|nr:hypothetical protein [Deltaproteobacteria bacterium]
MVDIHCHILPEIDDGASCMDEALEMCRLAVDDGITKIVATPHYNPDLFNTSLKKVPELLSKLKVAVSEAGLPLELFSAAEVALAPGVLEKVRTSSSLTFGGLENQIRYFLAELPANVLPPNWDSYLLSHYSEGLIPILVHPERDNSIAKRPEILDKFIAGGGVLQITAGSITGELGERALHTSAEFLEKGYVHIIASDAHSSGFRKPALSEAARVASDIIGREKAQNLVIKNPQSVLSGLRFSSSENLHC